MVTDPRVLVIGAGFGARVVAGVYRETGMAVEVVSPRDEAALNAALDQNLDLVSVHSPPFLHAHHVSLALVRGLNVLCDKPFGRSAAEAKQMHAAAVDAGVLHFVNFEFREEPAQAAIGQLLKEGAIGALRHLQWTTWYDGSRNPLRAYGWLFDRDSGGGWIGANGSHMLDNTRNWGGELEVANCTARTDIARRPNAEGALVECTAEDAFNITLRFKSGATANLDSAFAAPLAQSPRIYLIGETGIIELAGSTKLSLLRRGKEPEIRGFPAPIGDPHLPALRPWFQRVRQAIVERRQITPSFEDGVACAKLMDAARASAGLTT